MKVIWTYAPFSKNGELHEFGKNLLNTLFDKKDYLEVLYISSNAESELATSFNIPIEKRYTAYPKKIMKEQLKKLNLLNFKIEVLYEKTLSLTGSIKRLVSHSKETKIDLIVIATNEKKTLPKIILGSFAETLVHMSVCDLLIYHQKTQFNFKKPLKIIYAHDFSLKGFMGMVKVIEYAKKWNSHLTIIYVPIPSSENLFNDFKKMTERQVSKIEKILAENKMSSDVCIEYGKWPISDVLIETSVKIKADIIAVTAQSSRFSALLGGSITIKVLRESVLPVLVLKV